MERIFLNKRFKFLQLTTQNGTLLLHVKWYPLEELMTLDAFYSRLLSFQHNGEKDYIPGGKMGGEVRKVTCYSKWG